MRHINRIGLVTPSSRQMPFLEFKDGMWRIWLAYEPNSQPLFGTHICLGNNGRATRVTTNANCETTNVVVLNGEETETQFLEKRFLDKEW